METNNTTGRGSSLRMSRPTEKTRIMNDAFGILEALKTAGLSKATPPVRAGGGSGDYKHQRYITLNDKVLRIEFCLKPLGWAEETNIITKDGAQYVRVLSTNVGEYTVSGVKSLPCEKQWADEDGYREGEPQLHYINWIIVHGATAEQRAYLESLGSSAAELFGTTETEDLSF
jgi:hypothetical protein